MLLAGYVPENKRNLLLKCVPNFAAKAEQIYVKRHAIHHATHKTNTN